MNPGVADRREAWELERRQAWDRYFSAALRLGWPIAQAALMADEGLKERALRFTPTTPGGVPR